MTDKQIIIDGVDVSGCEYHSLNKNNCSLCSLSNNLICSYKPFCYYKQLLRKEQECEELKKLLKVRIEDLCDSCGASSMMPMPCKVYEKTLTEIKEIAEKISPLCIYEDWKCTDLDNTVECPAKAKCPRECRNKILQKISEVENETINN